jgi:hypothetical protein
MSAAKIGAVPFRLAPRASWRLHPGTGGATTLRKSHCCSVRLMQRTPFLTISNALTRAGISTVAASARCEDKPGTRRARIWEEP